jgi:hypothetical protein
MIMSKNTRPQTQKDRNLGRVRSVQELRRSSAADPIPSGARYDRNDFRNLAQRGLWDSDQMYEV